MRKIRYPIALSIIVMVALVVTSCGASLITIEHRTWSFSHIQNDKGEIVYCSDSAKAQYSFDDADIISLSCNIGNNTITLADERDSWSISYSIDGESDGSTLYDIESNGTKGYATVGKTVRENGNDEYTMILVLDGYSLYFNAPIN